MQTKRFRPRLATLLLLASAGVLHAQSIHSPWDGHPVAATDKGATCPKLETVPADLKTDSFYKVGDPTHSIIDPERMEAYNKSSGPAKAAATAVVHEADQYRTTGSRAAAACTVSLLMQMARDNSLAGHMSSGQAYYVQGWLGGAMAIAFLKVRESGAATPDETRAIAAWLQKLGTSTRDWYDEALAKKPAGNNHLYWAGLELCAIGAVADNRKDFTWGLAAYRNGIRQIAEDGTLPLEMTRGARALHYHLYALAPLVLIAEFGQVNGIPLYDEDHGALLRLARVSVAGLGNPALFAERTGIAQEAAAHPGGDQVAWAPPFLARYPDPVLQRFVEQAPTLYSFYLGGLPAPANHAPKP